MMPQIKHLPGVSRVPCNPTMSYGRAMSDSEHNLTPAQQRRQDVCDALLIVMMSLIFLGILIGWFR